MIICAESRLILPDNNIRKSPTPGRFKPQSRPPDNGGHPKHTSPAHETASKNLCREGSCISFSLRCFFPGTSLILKSICHQGAHPTQKNAFSMQRSMQGKACPGTTSKVAFPKPHFRPWADTYTHNQQEAGMTEQTSFTRIENDVVPVFRMKISRAESTEDVKKFFFQTLRDLFTQIFNDAITFEREDVVLHPADDPCVVIMPRLITQPAFAETWAKSDLKRVVDRLALMACNRYLHLDKNPEKTNAKIRG